MVPEDIREDQLLEGRWLEAVALDPRHRPNCNGRIYLVPTCMGRTFDMQTFEA